MESSVGGERWRGRGMRRSKQSNIFERLADALLPVVAEYTTVHHGTPLLDLVRQVCSIMCHLGQVIYPICHSSVQFQCGPGAERVP